MGPAAWAAVGRALGAALVGSLIFGPYSLVAVAAREIERAIIENELALAEAMLRDMAVKHRASFEEFMREYGDTLPEEVRAELAGLLE